MRTRNRYKFTLTASLLDEIIFSQQVYPQFSDLNMKYTKEADQVYYTPSFDSKLSFVDEEFDLIVGQDLRAKFSLSMQDTYHIFSTKQMSFMRTDCEIDMNHKLVTVTPKLFNPYKKIIDKRDEEHSVVDMGLEKHDTYFKIHPLREYYLWQDSKICVFNDSLLPAYSNIKNMPVRWQDMTNVNITGDDANKDLGFKNMYACGGIGTGTLAGRWSCLDNVFHVDPNLPMNHFIMMFRSYTPTSTVPEDYAISLQWTQTSPLEEVYWFINLHNSSGTLLQSIQLYGGINSVIGQRQTVTFTGYGTFTFQAFHVFSRMVTAITGLNEGDNVKAIDYAEDIYPLRYKFALRDNQYFGSIYNSYNFFFCKFSTRISDTDKGFGKIQEGADAGKYYDKPDDNGIWQPVYTESWFQGVSVWFYMRGLALDSAYYRAVKLPDSYKLGDVIKSLLGKINSDIVFEADEYHSQFLFSQINPVTGVSQNKKYITQKSNYLNYEYDYPAW